MVTGRRIVVKVELDDKGHFVAACKTGDCTWRHDSGCAVRAAVDEQARRHRDAHRSGRVWL